MLSKCTGTSKLCGKVVVDFKLIICAYDIPILRFGIEFGDVLRAQLSFA